MEAISRACYARVFFACTHGLSRGSETSIQLPGTISPMEESADTKALREEMGGAALGVLGESKNTISSPKPKVRVFNDTTKCKSTGLNRKQAQSTAN